MTGVNRDDEKILRLPGTLDSLSAVSAYVADVAQAVGLDGHAVYTLRLAVDEIATNAVVHGYGKAKQSGELVVRRVVSRDKLTIILQDSGPPYDPRQTPPPQNLGQDPEDRPAGGFGVYLALQGVDAFSYEYIDGENHHIFVMYRKH